MRALITSSFLWRFVGGFALGTVGLFALQPAEASRGFDQPVAVTAPVR
ncbi:hypothetical protein [Sphingomonas sp. Leaf17]|nr:hypothetical protein [Sphingomonas sp. Leaf17]